MATWLLDFHPTSRAPMGAWMWTSKPVFASSFAEALGQAVIAAGVATGHPIKVLLTGPSGEHAELAPVGGKVRGYFTLRDKL